MKNNRFIKTLMTLLLVAGVSSCNSTDEPDGPNVETAKNGAFILNQGSYQLNNAGVAYFDTSVSPVKLTEDLFFDVNGVKLGDNATDIQRYGDYIYVSLTGSNCIYKLDETGKLINKVLFHTDTDLQGGVRYMAFKDNYIYASFYGGMVAKISAENLKVEKKLQTSGANLEGIVEYRGTLYIANSYESVYNATTGYSDIIYGKNLITVNLSSFTEAGSVTVSENPNKLLVEDGKIFLISWGNYADKGYSFQMIEPNAGNKVTELGVATDMTAGDGKVYLLNSVTDWNTWATTNTWFTYDIKSGKIDNKSFMADAPASMATEHVSMMAYNDGVYVGTTHYTLSNGEIFRFDRDGKFLENFDCGGQNPVGIAFLK